MRDVKPWHDRRQAARENSKPPELGLILIVFKASFAAAILGWIVVIL